MWKFLGAAFLFLTILAGILVVKFMQIDKDEKTRANTTQDQKGSISLALDAYAGYYPLRSDEMVSQMLANGYRLATRMDDGDYEARIKMLENGEVDLAVFTVDSFILNGAPEGYPGVIIAVLSESHGSDALVARTSVAGTLDDLKANDDIRISYTPKSPSEHLLKVVGSHFGVEHFLKRRGDWRVRSDGSGEAMAALLDGKSDAAVLWEPDISRVLEKKDYTKLLGTELTRGIIVDILVANRSFLESRGSELELFLSTYFSVLKSLRGKSDLMVSGLAKQEKVSRELAGKMVDGVMWQSLYQNAVDWFGIAEQGANPNFGLYRNIEQTTQIMIEAGDFSSSPLPDGDPRQIFLARPVEKLYRKMDSGELTSQKSGITFTNLSDSGWRQLRPVGTLQVDPIPFNSGSGAIDNSGKSSIGKLVEKLGNYPALRILIEGHTGTNGDRQSNIELSQQRADAVKQMLEDSFSIDANRLKSIGVGPDQPLKRADGESIRAWRNRLSRVEIKFLKETY